MVKVLIKPLSVNQCWAGRRFKTPKYKEYEKNLLSLLPKKCKIPKGNIVLNAFCGYSSKLADIDNFLKPFIDILQKKYGFNDSRIFKLVVEKEIVKKGEEFIEFKIEKYDTNYKRG